MEIPHLDHTDEVPLMSSRVDIDNELHFRACLLGYKSYILVVIAGEMVVQMEQEEVVIAGEMVERGEQEEVVAAGEMV